MPGNRYLLDTNAVVALLQGNADVANRCRSADWLGISIITVLEFNSFAALSEKDAQLFRQFASRVCVVDLAHADHGLIDLITSVRKGRQTKLPDAIVLASAIHHAAELVTNDQQLLKLQDTAAGITVSAFAPGAP